MTLNEKNLDQKLTPVDESITFNQLSLHPKLLQAIEFLGHTIPTPIQCKAIPKILNGCDLRASAETGTGKTAAFLLPALNRLTVPHSIKGQGPRILILVPTRELAMQVAEEATKYSRFIPHVKTVCVYGGAPYPPQNRQLSRPYDILVATPGRLIDHMSKGRIPFNRIEMFVLDEADRMLDMGFMQSVEQIAKTLPKEHQTLMFSATLKGPIMKLSERLLTKPLEISIDSKQNNQDNIEQGVFHLGSLKDKYTALNHLLTDLVYDQAIVFTSTKHHAGILHEHLLESGHSAAALHGDMNQHQRSKTVARLRRGEIKILVATDVAARGIDVPTISHVINFDLPNNVEDYVHRIGRTGRAGAKGTAISFSGAKDFQFLRRIEQFIGKKINLLTIPGMPVVDFTAKKSFDDNSRKGPKGNFRSRRTFTNSRKPSGGPKPVRSR